MEFWIKAAQLVLSLALLVTLHELGHFIPAKIFKTRVEKFYLFFNPWLSLFRYKKVNGKKKEGGRAGSPRAAAPHGAGGTVRSTVRPGGP